MALTAADLQAIKDGKLTIEQAQAKQSEVKLAKLKVAEASGWLSLYFTGLRRPVTVPAEIGLLLAEPEIGQQIGKFVKDNWKSFKHKS